MSLGELNDGVLNNVKFMLSDMALSIPEERIFLCPVDDEVTHFKMMEELLETQVKYPFAVAARSQTPQLTQTVVMRAPSGVARNVTVGAGANGEINTVTAAPIKIMYTLFIYTDDLEDLDSFIEKFILSADVGYEHFSYSPVGLGGESLDASIVFGEIETVASSLDDVRESGVRFTLVLPMEVESILTSAITASKTIDDVNLNVEATVELGS